MPFEKSVGAVMFRREKKKIIFLILLKTPRKAGAADYWGFPQGHIEKGETWQDTLKREVWEETGLKKISIVSGFNSWVKYFYRAVGEEARKRKKKNIGLNVFKIVTFYLAETKAEKITLSHEHIDNKWVPYKEAHKLITYKQTKKVLEKANRFLIAKISNK